MKTDWRDPEPPGGGSAMPRLALPTLTPVTKRLMILNAVVFGAWFLVFLSSEKETFERLGRVLGLTTSEWFDGFPLLPIWQLVTYGFLHDPAGLWHLIGNMLLLYFFGTMLEGILGGRRFLVLYLGAMLAGAGLHLLTTSSIALFGGPPNSRFVIGASGAALGIVMAAATLRPNQTVFLLFIPITLKVLAIGLLVLDLFGLMLSLKADDGVAHWVHLGGAIYGFGAVKLGWVWRDPIQIAEAKRAIRAEERRVDETQEMDRLLEKIHREGMSALTKREKAFLKRASKK